MIGNLPFWIAAVASSGGLFSPFAVSGAHDGFIADEGVTDIGGFADAIADQTGNGNTLTAPGSTRRPEIITGWRNGRAALLGRADASTVYLGRATCANGALAQPFTRYIVGGWTSGDNKYLVSGGASRQCYARQTSGLPSVLVPGVGAADRTAATAPAVNSPFIWRVAFKGGAIDARIEPHGAAPIEWSGANGADAVNGIYLLGSPAGAVVNWQAQIAFKLDIAGDLPLSSAALDAQILAWLRNYYNILHT